MSNRNKNIINVPKAQQFLNDVYGMKTQAINSYQLRGWVEEFNGWWDWYHTTGTLVLVSKGEDDVPRPVSLGRNQYKDEEEVAIAVLKNLTL